MLNGLDEVEGLTDEQKEAINNLAGGVVSKNTELLEKLQKSKDSGTATTAELEQLRQFKENADIQAAEASKNWEETKKLLQEKHDKELGTLTDRLTNSETTVEKLLVDDGLSKALDNVKVNPTLKAGAAAMLRNGITVSDGKAVVGEKSLSEHVTEWAKTDAGKAFCLAPENSGGDANGGNKGDNSKKGNDAKANLQERLKKRGLTN